MVFDFHYDAQIRRYLLQFIRIFSLLKIQTAPDENGAYTESTVPVMYGDINRTIAHVLKNNSENTILPSPMMSVWIANLQPAPDRRCDPYFIGKLAVDERKFEDGEYTNEMGHQYSIDRYMPSPYDLTLQLDIWTTNTTTKLQLFEQIMTIFNPSVQIQQHENMLDWSIMMDITLTDIKWTNRSIPQGTDAERDVGSLTFNVPVWIHAPAKVKRKALIEQIVMNVYDVAEIPDERLNKILFDPIKSCFDAIAQIIVSPGNHKVKVGMEGVGSNELQLLTEYGVADPDLSWETLINEYGELQVGSSFITLKSYHDIEKTDGDITGTIVLHPTDQSKLIFTVDVDTLPAIIPSGPVDLIIDPQAIWPGNQLPGALVGQRYLLSNDIPDSTGTSPWGNVRARTNDIIEFNGAAWFVSFDATTQDNDQYVSVITGVSQHYQFTNGEWNHTYFGEYHPGYWRLTLQDC